MMTFVGSVPGSAATFHVLAQVLRPWDRDPRAGETLVCWRSWELTLLLEWRERG